MAEEQTEAAFRLARELALTILGSADASAGSPEELDRAVANACEMAATVKPDAPPVDPVLLRRSLEEVVNVFVPESTSLSDDRDHIPWLDNERTGIDWKFWERYKAYLDVPPRAIRSLDSVTDDVLGRLESPNREGYWDRRGMIVGQVQSGKTSNYLGLICKAADAGYRVIVVLAGLHNSLRSQTQMRVDAGFLGFDSRTTLMFNDRERNSRVGAGAQVANSKLIPVFSYTSSLPNGDFNRNRAAGVAAQVGSDPVVLVIKKNKTILENLIAWTRTQADLDPHRARRVVLDQPLLIIDDEADNASVNTKEMERELDEDGNFLRETDPTTINRLIRELLSTFQKSAYVGYTATPFANIFIDGEAKHELYGEDLFPRSFIVRLSPPSNYVGPAKVFGVRPAGGSPDRTYEPLDIIRPIDDFDDFVPERHNKYLQVGPLPESLREAIRTFVIACAARRARGQIEVDNSMLVHVTRFVDVQTQVEERIADELDSIKNRLREGEGGSTHTLLGSLQSLWNKDLLPTSQGFDGSERGEMLDWSQVQPELLAAAERIRIRRINGSSGDVLDYADNSGGLSVIAIGGDKLSRGLTLEGLTVSYYLRASKMYDTLMQMGRWFGYRPGYLDLCRLYTTTELVEWYRDITIANEELSEEFDSMVAAGGTPANYGLRIRKHSAGLKITAPAKMREGRELDIGFGGDGIPTTAFSLKPQEHQENFSLVEGFLEQIAPHRDGESVRQDPMWRNVPGADIANLLADFQVSPRSRRAFGPDLYKFIEQAVSEGELENWTVALINKRDASPRTIAGLEIGLTDRAPRKTRGKIAINDAYSIGQLLSPSDEWIDLSQDELEVAKRDTAKRWGLGQIQVSSDRPPEIDGIGTREARPTDRGLLLLYPLDPARAPEPLDSECDVPIFGFFASLPSGGNASPVTYTVNTTYWNVDLGL